jgi:hypothetical protein
MVNADGPPVCREGGSLVFGSVQLLPRGNSGFNFRSVNRSLVFSGSVAHHWSIGHMRVSRTGIIVSAAPGLLALGLFYSLAIHMHQSLGKWPAYIGTGGFPLALRTHSEAAVIGFGILIQSLIILPLPLFVSIFVPRWQKFAPYLAVYGASAMIGLVLTMFAPPPFLTWWRD